MVAGNFLCFAGISAAVVGLCGCGSDCLHLAQEYADEVPNDNPARDGRLKEIYSEYMAAGCKLVVAPICPGVFDRCYLNEDGKGVCFQ